MAQKKTVVAIIPEDDRHADQLIMRIGELDRAIKRIKEDLSDQCAKLTEQAEERIKPLQEDKDSLNKGSDIYATRNRIRLTRGTRRKTVKFPHGEYQWRLAQAKVVFEEEDEPEIIAACEEEGKDRFVATTKKIDKKAMLREKDVAKDINGITIIQDEYFRVRFYEPEAE